MLFDTHAHYDDPQFDPDRDAVLSGLAGQGVGLVVNPGCTLASSRRAVALAEQYPFVYAAVGVHPEECADWTPADVDALRALAAHPKVRAIGEIGLDYYWPENPPPDFQKEVLRAQMALAEELKLPVIIHDRDAHEDMMAIVREFPGVTGVFHCYSGSLEDAKVLIKLGWMLSFNGALTFRNARKAPEVAAWAPLDRLMVETDSPYLSPVPFRGKRNDSGRVRLVAEKLAQLKGLSVEEVERATTENGRRFFGIPD